MSGGECRRVLVTGASGFVGGALLPVLIENAWEVIALSRGAPPPRNGFDLKASWCRIADFDGNLPLAGCNVVVHLAARVHVMDEQSADPLAEFRLANVAATERLARQAAAAGIKRFVFLSSIKVNGEETAPGRPFSAEDVPAPEDAYGISKHEAEVVLRRVARETGLEVVIIRSPLVYGPGVKGNFETMLKWLHRGLPLPLALLNNRRSLVGGGNLCDLIQTCLVHPKAANETFLVSDNHDLSTVELLQLAGRAMGHPARLWPLPPSWLLCGAAMIGKQSVARRLCNNLQVDIGKTKYLLGWTPPVDVETGLRQIFDSG
jgi:nucleoside-diphosphate-sugar epimerase